MEIRVLMMTRVECGPNFLLFVLRLRETPGKNPNQEIDPTGSEPWPAALVADFKLNACMK